MRYKNVSGGSIHVPGLGVFGPGDITPDTDKDLSGDLFQPVEDDVKPANKTAKPYTSKATAYQTRKDKDKRDGGDAPRKE